MAAPNPGWSATEITQRTERLSYLSGMWWDFERMRRHFLPVETDRVVCRIENGDEGATEITRVDITTCNLFTSGSDTGAGGYLWCTLTDGTGGTGHSVDFYKDSSRSTKVAAIATVDDGNAATIVPETGYTLAGSFTCGTISGNVTFLLRVIPPLQQSIDDLFAGEEEEDNSLKAAMIRRFRQIDSTLKSAQAGVEALAREFAQTTLRRTLTSVSSNSLISPGLVRESAGNVTSSPSGVLQDFLLQAAQNTTPIEVQSAVHPTISLSYGSAWEGEAANVTLDDRGFAAVFTLTCTKGLDANPPTFRVMSKPTDSRHKGGATYTQDIEAENLLTVGQAFRSDRLGITGLTVNYKETFENSTSTPGLSTTSTDWSVTGLTSSNSAAGVVYCIYNLAADEFRFYSTSAGRDAETASLLIASAANPGTSTSFTATGSAGITIVGKTNGSTPLTGATIDVNFNAPSATTPAAYATATVTLTTEPGLIQKATARGLFSAPWKLNSDTSGVNVTDAMTNAGTLMGGRSFGTDY